MKKFKLILALGMLLTCVIKAQNTIASPTNNCLESSEGYAIKIHTIEEQANAIKQYISKENIEFPRLVLGVPISEPDLTTRFDKNYIFLDERHIYDENCNKTQFSERSITIDFNDLEQLKELEKHFHDFFDKIILDASSLKDTEWNKEHISIFRNMLSPNGEFILGIGDNGIGYLNNNENNTQIKAVLDFYGNNAILNVDSGLFIYIDKTAFLEKCYDSVSKNLSLNPAKFTHQPLIDFPNVKIDDQSISDEKVKNMVITLLLNCLISPSEKEKILNLLKPLPTFISPNDSAADAQKKMQELKQALPLWYREMIDDTYKAALIGFLNTCADKKNIELLKAHAKKILVVDKKLHVSREYIHHLYYSPQHDPAFRDFVTEEVVKSQVKLLKSIFGDNNVAVAENKPLPFTTHYGKAERFLTTCIKK